MMHLNLNGEVDYHLNHNLQNNYFYSRTYVACFLVCCRSHDWESVCLLFDLQLILDSRFRATFLIFSSAAEVPFKELSCPLKFTHPSSFCMDFYNIDQQEATFSQSDAFDA